MATRGDRNDNTPLVRFKFDPEANKLTHADADSAEKTVIHRLKMALPEPKSVSQVPLPIVEEPAVTNSRYQFGKVKYATEASCSSDESCDNEPEKRVCKLNSCICSCEHDSSSSSDEPPCPGCELCDPKPVSKAPETPVTKPELTVAETVKNVAETVKTVAETVKAAAESVIKTVSETVVEPVSESAEKTETITPGLTELVKKLTHEETTEEHTIPVEAPVVEPVVPIKTGMPITHIKETRVETVYGIRVREVYLDDLPIIFMMLIPLFALGYLIGKWFSKRTERSFADAEPRYSAHPSRSSILPIYEGQTSAMMQTDAVEEAEEAMRNLI